MEDARLSPAELLAAADSASSAATAILEAGDQVSLARDGRAALFYELRALRFTLEATLVPPPGTVEEAPPRRWARVELFGHRVVYAAVDEVTFGGRRFLQFTTPAPLTSPGEPDEVKLYHPNAVYALEEVGETEVRLSCAPNAGPECEDCGHPLAQHPTVEGSDACQVDGCGCETFEGIPF